ncbi:MAG: NAD(+) diphosphatase [Treponema sp.]|nr:NAD(+) diphosphatase [Treponema sp.]
MSYIFYDNNLIVREDTPDNLIREGLSPALMDEALKTLNVIDVFTIPALDGGPGIKAITLGEGGLPSAWKAIPLRQTLPILSGGGIIEGRGLPGRILRAHHISIWRQDSRFCGSCGTANEDAREEDIARKCPSCGRLEFPRIAPAVTIIVRNDKDEALLAQGTGFVPKTYSLIAGFNEPGESLEDTVIREVKEEVNVDVGDIHYIRSQPWPFPCSLMLGFTARYKGGELKPDGVEIADARWFSRDALPNLPGSASLSRHLINLWLERKL